MDIEIEEPIITNRARYSGEIFETDSPIWNLPISQEATSDGWFLGQDNQGNPLYQLPDNCPFGDLSGDKYDGGCLPWGQTFDNNEMEQLATLDNFEVEFAFPIVNR